MPYDYLTINDNDLNKGITSASYFNANLQSLYEQQLVNKDVFYGESDDDLFEFTLYNNNQQFVNFNRIIPSITSQLLANKEMEISKGDQYLPILSVQDTCEAISMAIQTDQASCSASPMWYGKLKDLANLMHQALKKGNLKVKLSKVSIDDSFPQVQFPPTVKNWSPSFGFEDFLITLKSM